MLPKLLLHYFRLKSYKKNSQLRGVGHPPAVPEHGVGVGDGLGEAGSARGEHDGSESVVDVHLRDPDLQKPVFSRNC